MRKAIKRNTYKCKVEKTDKNGNHRTYQIKIESADEVKAGDIQELFKAAPCQMVMAEDLCFYLAIKINARSKVTVKSYVDDTLVKSTRLSVRNT